MKLQNDLKALLLADSTFAGLVAGGVWTRRIARNVQPDPALPPTPGSTPEAFDAAGRIKLCCAVLGGTASANPLGPPAAYSGFPQLWFYCLPHDSEQHKLEQAVHRAYTLLDGAQLAGYAGEGIVLRWAGRRHWLDAPELGNAGSVMVRWQVDSLMVGA